VLINGTVMPMEAHYLPVVNLDGEIMEWKMFCTGLHDIRAKKERIDDDKVS